MKAWLSDSTTVTATGDQVSTSLGDEAAILHLKSGVYYGLNPVGARVWALLQAGRTVGTIRDTLVAEYEVDPTSCERDLHVLLADLAEAGLVETRDATAP